MVVELRELGFWLINNFYFREFTFTVEWRPVGAYINCNCRKFEFKGVLCCHILKVMCQKDIQTVDDKYVLTGWRNDVYPRHPSIFFLEVILT
ncbi:hypothetical protein ACS0TY_022162 [Phlomoides rotata]